MSSSNEMRNVFRRIASYTPRDIGFLEEDVKIKVVVPILQCLGYNLIDLSFEHSRIDIFVKGLPKGCGLVIEVKKLGENLDKHSVQLGRYIEQTNALLGVITNGDEFRIFAGSVETVLRKIQRKDLASKENIETLQHLLAKKVLITEEEALTNVSKECERRVGKLNLKIRLARDMMSALKSKNAKKIKELTSEANKKDIDLLIDLEEMEGLLKSMAKIEEKMKNAARAL